MSDQPIKTPLLEKDAEPLGDFSSQEERRGALVAEIKAKTVKVPRQVINAAKKMKLEGHHIDAIAETVQVDTCTAAAICYPELRIRTVLPT